MMNENEHSESKKVFWISPNSASWLTVFTTIIAVLGGAIAVFVSDYQNNRFLSVSDKQLSSILNTHRDKIDSLDQEIQEIRDDINSLRSITTDQKMASSISSVNEKIESIENKLSIIDTAIVENPERAMSLPILRRDLDALGADLRGDVIATRKDVDRVYDLNKWFIGLMATMAIGVLGLAVGNILKGKE